MCESWVFIISTLFRGQLLLVKLEIVIVTLDSVLGGGDFSEFSSSLGVGL